MKQKLFHTPEGKILLTGFILTFLLLMAIGYFAFIDMETAKTLGLTFFAHAFGGRAAGIGLCIMNGFGATATIVYNFYLEVLIVCFTYSIFALTTTNYIRVLWLTKLMGKLADKAVEQKDKIQSFGWIGLFLFVMLPLPVTGPVVGSVIGYMLRINLARNFSATGAGTLAAIIAWFFCFDFLEQRFHAIQYIFAGIILLVLLTRYKSIIKFFSGNKTDSNV
ncbi:MAG: small multi-drug export protein [Proteobacteria bacterium]|nr:small multi-drug export protein [Pseudomonadota bacterium]MBU1584133.1 small multi-drug export protein [Pseudomonadota bacterium]MBU2453416.1 small multi-drug export protein [Pseudomonadota bacterium]MBU2628918.1 small multi-drug export protein [Pseudomonadota bacterium]